MVIWQDTREQNPLRFETCSILTEVKVSTVPVGDYIAEYNSELEGNWNSHTTFDRKSKEDLWGTLTADHDRFKREIERSADLGLNLILITECSLDEVREGYFRSKFSGESMLKKLMTLEHKYGLRTVFCGSRVAMADYIKKWFIAEGVERLRISASS